MAKQQDNSQFHARADSAALALRKSLNQRGANIPDSRTVEVDENGNQPAPLPPQGSYARQRIELQRRQQQQQAQPEQTVDDGSIQMQRQDPQATLEGDIGSDTVGTTASTGEQPQLSANAQQRIAKLTEDLRRKDQEMQALVAESQKTKSGMAELESKLNALQNQHQQVLEQSLANMDPDTRTQILMDGRLSQAIAESESRIMNSIVPHLTKMERQAADAEMRRLSTIYPGFSMETHAALIETFRKANPRCTVEQAFRAVAEPEELQMASQVRASPVPPVNPPGNGRWQSRNQETQSNPEDELVAEAQQLKKLMASSDPADRQMGDRFLHNHLSKRLGGRLPG